MSIAAVSAISGSSPHTRGARPPCTRRPSGSRIIPAYAGSTPASRPLGGRVADHPRIRGEHHRILVPRVCEIRIIPAYAGSTGDSHQKSRGYRDHPRIRGEHARTNRKEKHNAGSSPHTRGALGVELRHAGSLRIIPAYAGSTAICPGWRRRSGDHPRIRGEHSMYSNLRTAARGSSPHTRGAPTGR